MKKIFLLFLISPLGLLAQKKVGIGTTTPVQRLSVDSTMNVDQGNFDDGTKPSLRFGDINTGEAIGSRRTAGGSNPFGLDFWTGTGKRMTITNGGYIGIATDTPQVALAVNGDVLIDYHSTNNGVTGRSLRFGNAGSGEGISSARSGSINPFGLNLFTNYTPRLSVAQTGEVGIGTTSPIYKLHVKTTGSDQVPVYAEGADATFASSYINSTSTTAFAGFGMLRQNVVRGYVGINPNNDLVLARVRPAQGLQAALTVANSTGNVGIGTTNPGVRLEVVDTAAFPVYIRSSHPTQTIVEIGSDAVSPAYLGIGYYKTGTPKAFMVMDASDNLIISDNAGAAPHLVINPSGNIGIGTNSPGFPLNFANTTGEKIAFYQNSGNNYGIGIQNLLMQFHTDISTADIAFGYGSSASFNETMRIKGNGNLNVKGDVIADVNGTNNGFVFPGLRLGTATSGEGISSKRTAGGNQNGLDFYTNGAARISVDNSGLVGINGNTTPGARLQINQTGNYNNSENSTHALEIWDNNETLYMGADGGNSISYIQAVGNSTFHTLALQARGGNVAIGKNTAAEKVDVNGNGAFSGNLTVQSGKGMVRNYSSTQLKTEAFTFQFSGLVALGAGNTTNLSVTFPEAYTAVPVVYVAGLIPSAGSAGYLECVYNISSISTTGFTLSIYNPRASGATFNNGSPNFQINFAAIGPQ